MLRNNVCQLNQILFPLPISLSLSSNCLNALWCSYLKRTKLIRLLYMHKILATYVIQNQYLKQVASAQHNTLYIYKTRGQHNTTHSTPTRLEVGHQCTAQHTHCIPTRPETILLNTSKGIIFSRVQPI